MAIDNIQKQIDVVMDYESYDRFMNIKKWENYGVNLKGVFRHGEKQKYYNWLKEYLIAQKKLIELLDNKQRILK